MTPSFARRLPRLLPLALLAAGLATPALVADNEPADVNIKVIDKDAIEFRCGSDLVGRYNIGALVAKPYMWPLNAPGGVTVTRPWPMEKKTPDEKDDHPHQKSMWFCHGDVIPEGIELKNKNKNAVGVDFWTEEKNHGRIVCTKVGAVEQKGNHGKVTTTNEWISADDVKILDETRTIHLYNYGKATMFVFEIDLEASVCPITFGDTKEGSFGVRVRDSVNTAKGKGTLTNAEGKSGEKEVWGHASDWCDYSGPADDKTAGIAIFTDPANPPSSWHSRGYGLMAANPFGRDKSGFPAMKGKTDLVKIAKGEHLKLRYGILLHGEDAKTADVASYYKAFVYK